MTEKEYKDKLHILYSTYCTKVDALNLSYAMSNDPVNTGDIISDNVNTIKVLSKELSFNRNNCPCFTYYGYTDKQLYEFIFQYNIVRINGKTITKDN